MYIYLNSIELQHIDSDLMDYYSIESQYYSVIKEVEEKKSSG